MNNSNNDSVGSLILAGDPSSQQQNNRAPNPRHPVPSHVYVGVEHPFKIHNASRAIESLGGERKIAKLVAGRESESIEIQLLLHPGRYQLNSVISDNTSGKSLVCQVTVPKLIGRKRKRSADAERIEPHGLSAKGRLIRSLNDNPSACQLHVVGQYHRVHKFRTLPDFAFSQQRNRFMRSFNETIGSLKYENVKRFQLKGNEDFRPDEDLVPPPIFSPHTIPFNYAYQQNTSVKVVVGADGEVTTHNESTAQRSIVPRVAIDVKQVPIGPPPGVVPLEAQPAPSKALVQKLQTLFKDRPIWSRRAVYFQFQGEEALSGLKWLFQYVGYEFAAGPWAMTVIRYGVDPRSSREYRFYQTITLHFEPQTRHHPTKPAKTVRGGARQAPRKVERVDKDGVPGYMFTGRTLVLDGKTWQVYDIQDPLISAIFSTENLRSECDMESDGWFKNGTWAKAKVIFRYKARALLNDDPSWIEEDFARAAEMPDEFNPALKDLPISTTGWPRRSILIAYHIKHGSLTFGKHRSQMTSSEVSESIMQALRKHDGERGYGGARAEESLEELLDEEQDLLREGRESDVMDDSQVEDMEEEDAGEVDG